MATKISCNPKSEEYSAIQMLGTARAFLMAARKCSEPGIQQLGWSHASLIPVVTNMAFSCELFLKAILKEANSPERGHNLLKLYDALPADVKRDITGLDNEQDFLSEIDHIACLFEEWRYIYEYNLHSLNFSFLSDFAERLSTYAQKKFV